MPEFLTLRTVETKALDDALPGTLEALVAITGNEDLGRDVILAGAFEGFIAKVKSGVARMPLLLWDHGVDKGLAALTGKVLDIEELRPGDPRLPEAIQAKGLGGLKVLARYNLQTEAGRDAYAHLVAGDTDQFSFMYEAPEKSFDAKGRRLLKTIDPVYEVSNVLVGMNPETTVMGVKSLNGLLEEAAAIIDVETGRWTAVRAKVAAIVEAGTKAAQVPDSAFAYVDAESKSRLFLHHDEDGEPDEDLVKAALLAVPAAAISDEARQKALKHLHKHAKKLGIDTEAPPPAPQTKALDAYEDRQNAVRLAIQKLYPGPDDCWIYLRLTYADRAVYEVNGSGLSGTFQCTYAIDDTGAVTLGDPVAVTISEVVVPQSAGYELAGMIKSELTEPEPDFERVRWLSQVAIAVKSGLLEAPVVEPPVEDEVDAELITTALREQWAADLSTVVSETQFPATPPNVPAHTDGNEHLPNFARFGARPRL